ncbi:MAG: DUF3221 domain-containing protein [Clostridia bacterium]|jgi:predicted small secreted protein
MMKRTILLLITLTVLITAIPLLSGCSNDQDGSPDKGNPASSDGIQPVEYGVAGRITDISVTENGELLGTITVEGSKDNGAMYDKAVVSVSKDTKIYLDDLVPFDSLEVGMYVCVFFEGPVRESYPVQANAGQINIVPDESTKDDD